MQAALLSIVPLSSNLPTGDQYGGKKEKRVATHQPTNFQALSLLKPISSKYKEYYVHMLCHWV
jgi:hypothetical protein